MKTGIMPTIGSETNLLPGVVPVLILVCQRCR